MAISFQQFKLNYLWKMRGYPQFSFWILTAIAKFCSFHIVLNRAKNIVVLVGKFLKKPEYPKMRKTYAQ